MPFEGHDAHSAKPLSTHCMDVSAEHKLVPVADESKFQEIGFIQYVQCHTIFLQLHSFVFQLCRMQAGMSLKDDYLKLKVRYGFFLQTDVHWLRRRVQKVKLQSVSVSPLGSDPVGYAQPPQCPLTPTTS